MLSVLMLSVVMLNVILLSVVAPSNNLPKRGLTPVQALLTSQSELSKSDSDEHSSLYRLGGDWQEEEFYNFETWGQGYKTFYARNLWIFVISWSVCPLRDFPD